MVRIECDGGTCRIIDRLPSVPVRLIYGACAYQIANFDQIQRSWSPEQRKKFKHWTGMTHLFHKNHRTFPIGLLSIITKVLEDNEVEYLVTHTPSNEVKIGLPLVNQQFTPRPYQDDATNEAIENRTGIIRVATGGGKTAIAAFIMSHISQPALFLVHTKDLLYQAYEMFGEMFHPDKIGIIGDGKVDVKEITVATIQTMSRVYGVEYVHSEYEDDQWNDDDTTLARNKAGWIRKAMEQVGIVFMDECHRVAAPTAMEVMKNISNPRFRIGLSASPWRDDGADLAITACFGPVVYSITASDLIDLGFLVPPIIRMVDVKPRSFPRRVQYATVYKEYVVENEERNDRIPCKWTRCAGLGPSSAECP